MGPHEPQSGRIVEQRVGVGGQGRVGSAQAHGPGVGIQEQEVEGLGPGRGVRRGGPGQCPR